MAKVRMERTQHSLITDGVEEQEQTLSTTKPFWVFFVTNIGISTWLIGVLLAGMGLSFGDTLFVLLLGSLIGSAIPAAMGVLGPSMRLSQIEGGRFALGRIGKQITALFGWINAIGWDVVNNVIAVAALVALLSRFGLPVPFWLALAFIVGIQMVVGVYGHHLIQDTSKYTGGLLGIIFVIIGMIALHKTGQAPVTATAGSSKDIFAGLVLAVSSNLGAAPYASDYTRYLPRKTPGKVIFWPIFMAMFITLFVLAGFGYMTASAVPEQTPEGIMKMLEELTGRFAPLVLLLVAFNSIPVNAFNDNSAAYSLMSAGVKVSRPVSAIFGAVLGYVVCLLADSKFIDFFENFLVLFAHGIMPWAAVILVHWFTVGKKEQVTIIGIRRGFLVFAGVTTLSIFLFSASPLYTGILSNTIGGLDIGPYIGFVAAGLIYYVSLRLWPSKYKSIKA